MDILSVLECLDETRILREKSEHTDLHLRIIRYEEEVSRRWDKALLDLSRIPISGWDILQIGIVG